MFLLVCAAALLVSLAGVSPCHDPNAWNLMKVRNLATKCSPQLTEQIFVEDVSHLNECSNKSKHTFLCKVQDILNNVKPFCKATVKEELVRNLRMYHSCRKVNCTETLQGVKSTGDEILLPKLLEEVVRCIQNINYSSFHPKKRYMHFK